MILALGLLAPAGPVLAPAALGILVLAATAAQAPAALGTNVTLFNKRPPSGLFPVKIWII